MVCFECRRMSTLMKIQTCSLLYRLDDMREFCLIYDTFMSDKWLPRKCKFLFGGKGKDRDDWRREVANAGATNYEHGDAERQIRGRQSIAICLLSRVME